MTPKTALILTVAIITGFATGATAQGGGSGQQTPPVQRRAPVARRSPDPPAAQPAYSEAVQLSERALTALVAWKLQEANDILENSRPELGETPEFKTALGYLTACRGEYDEAVVLLNAAKTAKPGDPAPAFYLGETQRWRRQHDSARAAWDTAFDRARALIQTNDLDARGHYYMGAAELRRENFASARAALSAAGDAEFDAELVSYQIGLTNTLDKKWEQAIDAFDGLARVDPKFAYLYFYRGVAWGKRNRKDLMLIDMEQFLALAPDAPEADVARTYLSAK
jgi:tetratricopeptide (TPR) repeat protein